MPTKRWFKGDRTGPPYETNHKLNSAKSVYAQEWPDEEWPGDKQREVAYARLEAAGYIYSTRSGWNVGYAEDRVR